MVKNERGIALAVPLFFLNAAVKESSQTLPMNEVYYLHFLVSVFSGASGMELSASGWISLIRLMQVVTERQTEKIGKDLLAWIIKSKCATVTTNKTDKSKFGNVPVLRNTDLV
jgi:hypothetical protein